MQQHAALCRDRLDAPHFTDRAARALWEVTDATKGMAVLGFRTPEGSDCPPDDGRKRPPHPEGRGAGALCLTRDQA